MTGLKLVTAAAGKTGSQAVRSLIERGQTVRAFVHRVDERSEQLASAGAEIMVGDLLDLASVTAAVQGVSGAYFCYPIEPGLVEASAYFAEAAREHGVGAIVNMSQISARRDAASNAARQHWISERILDWSGVPTTHIRPTFFAEWLVMFVDQIKSEGILRLPFGDGRHAPISAEDQARVIAAILDSPASHAGQTYKLFGPEEMSHHDIAAELARTLNKPFRYEPVPVETFADSLRVRGRSEHLIQHLSNVAVDYQAGLFSGTNDVVERIGGRPATTVHDFIAQRRQLFSTAA